MADSVDGDRWGQLQRTLAGLEQRVARLEQAAGAAAPMAAQMAAPIAAESAMRQEGPLAPSPSAPPPEREEEALGEFVAATTARPEPKVRAIAPALHAEEIESLLNAKYAQRRAVAASTGESKVSLEELIGGRWFTWLGAGALALAVAYFVPWAWRHFDMPAWFRVMVFHLSGVGLLGGAWALSRKRLPVLAHGVAGLGVFTLYASAFAMEYHYKLWGPRGNAVTLLDCALITLAAIAIALRYNSVYIVLLGALGGYVTPVIAARGAGGFTETFTYLAFLNAALVITASIRPWRFLKPSAVVATAVMFLFWFDGQARGIDPWLWERFVGLHAALFLVGTNLLPLLKRQRSEGHDLAAMAMNSLWFVGATWLAFHRYPLQQMAIVCWGMAALHGALFAWSYSRLTNADRLPRMHLALAAVFFTLAVPLQMRDTLSYLAYAWAVEGFVFTAIGVYFRDRQMTVTGSLVLLLSFLRAAAFDFMSPPEFIGGSTIDRRLLVMLGVGAALAAAGSCHWWVARLSPHRDVVFDERGRREGAVLMGVGNLVAMFGLTCQWNDRTVLWLWLVDAVVLWVVALRSGKLEPRLYALAVGVLMVGGRVLYHGDRLPGPFTLVANERFLSLAAVAVVYLVAGWFERKLRRREQPDAGASAAAVVDSKSIPVTPDVVLHLLGHALMLAALFCEVRDSYRPLGSALGYRGGPISMEEHMTYSVTACIYAAILVAAGFALRYRLPRLLGLGGLLAVGLKVMLVDLAELALIYRVLILAALGALMLITSFWYQKFTTRLETGGD